MLIDEGFTERQIETEFSRETLVRYFIYREETAKWRDELAKRRDNK